MPVDEFREGNAVLVVGETVQGKIIEGELLDLRKGLPDGGIK
jgi:hypothetical protein